VAPQFNRPFVPGENSVASRASTYVEYNASPDTLGAPVFVPTVGTDNVFDFDIDVVAGQPILIAPEVAVGYDYKTGAGNPNFKTVKLPSVGDGAYDLFLFDAAHNPLDTGIDILAGILFDFTTELAAFGIGAEGLAEFSIRGIETSAGLDPTDATAFVTELTFLSDGAFTGSMTPLSVEVPEPATLMLLGFGIVATPKRSLKRKRALRRPPSYRTRCQTESFLRTEKPPEDCRNFILSGMSARPAPSRRRG
jgi:hypothetical protein